jgi:hypothetical protein
LEATSEADASSREGESADPRGTPRGRAPAIEEILDRSPGFELIGKAESGEEAVDRWRTHHLEAGAGGSE